MTDLLLSISDIATFKRCRQKWDFSSVNRQSLRHKIIPKLYLSEGSGLHEALDAQAKGEDPIATAQAYFESEREKMVEAYQESHVFDPWDIEMDEFDKSVEFCLALIQQYFDHYENDPLKNQGLTYLATEVPFKLFLSTDYQGNDVYFVGTWDGVAQDENGKVFLVENKTYSSPPDSSELMFHDQSTGYAVAFQALTGIRLTGMLYNGIAKRLVVQPKVLQNGKLSTDKRQSVTSQSYIEGMFANGIDPYDEHYTEILEHLRDRELQGDTRFHYQEKFFFPQAQLDSWYDELMDVACEMAENPRIFRTVPFSGCGDCWYRDLCRATHSDGDVDEVMKKYTTGTYGTMDALSGSTPTMVTSVEQLKASLRDG